MRGRTAERKDFLKKLERVGTALQQLKKDKKIVDFAPIGGGEIRRNPDFCVTCIKGPRHVGRGLFLVRNGKRNGNSSLKVSLIDSQDEIERRIIRLLQRP